MLFLVGLGLSSKHLTDAAKEVLERTDKVYLDTYTNVLDDEEIEKIEYVVKKTFVRASRHDLEDKMVEIIEEAREKDIAIAVSGDPFMATTHVSLYIEAIRRGVDVAYIPGVSIQTVAASLSGLQHYRFGRIVTVPSMWHNTPSFYEFIALNKRMNLHTLVLLDLHPEPVTIPRALEAILYWEEKRRLGVIDLGELVVGIARAGMRGCQRFVGTVEELMYFKWNEPPHVLVLPGTLHPVEEEFLYMVRRHGERC